MSLNDALARLDAALAEALRPHLDTGGHIWLAYSGGVDSELMALCLARWAKHHPSHSISLIHVHHGLSAYADQWAAHCRAQAQQHALPLEVVHVSLKQRPRVSVEASAREARYRAFAERMKAGDLLLTAHHLDDQAESLLLALKRGSGPLGLSGMAPIQPFAGGLQIRPWLGIRRREIEAAAATLSLSHIEDDSNRDPRFDRNFLRLDVLPMLNERWPGFSQAVARSAILCAEQQQLCDELAEQDLHRYRREDGALSASALLALSDARRNNLVRYWLREQGARLPSQVQMGAMKALWLAREDAQPQLDWGTHTLRRFQDGIYLLAQQTATMPNEENINLEAPLTLANGERWNFELAEEGPRLLGPGRGQRVTVRYGLPGTLRLKPAGRSGSRPLKKLWQEYGVPPWQRGRVAMLCYDGEVVAALGHWIESHALCQTGQGWQPVAQKTEQ